MVPIALQDILVPQIHHPRPPPTNQIQAKVLQGTQDPLGREKILIRLKYLQMKKQRWTRSFHGTMRLGTWRTDTLPSQLCHQSVIVKELPVFLRGLFLREEMAHLVTFAPAVPPQPWEKMKMMKKGPPGLPVERSLHPGGSGIACQPKRSLGKVVEGTPGPLVDIDLAGNGARQTVVGIWWYGGQRNCIDLDRRGSGG